jgi:hypothetical protein
MHRRKHRGEKILHRVPIYKNVVISRFVLKTKMKAVVVNVFARDIHIDGVGNTFVGCFVRCMGSTDEYEDKYGVYFDKPRNKFMGGRIETENYQPFQLHGFTGATMVRITEDLCELEATLIDGDTYTNTIAIELTGTVRGCRIECAVDQNTIGSDFEGASERLIKAPTAVISNIQATFWGDFPDSLMVDNPEDLGGMETEGMRKYFDLPEGWTGSISVTDISSDMTIDLDEGEEY